MTHCFASAMALVLMIFTTYAQTDTPVLNDAINEVDKVHDVTYCELARDPAAFDRKLVRLTAFVTHGFENFTLSDPSCHRKGFWVWIMYGGKAQSDTVYCCPGEGGSRSRRTPLAIEDVPIPLVEDATFKEFTDLLKREPDTTVSLTAVGRFFAGAKQDVSDGTLWGGFGHMGCCSLFAMQRVESFDSHTRRDVDYSADAGWSEDVDCEEGQIDYLKRVSISNPDREVDHVIAEQRKADSREEEWRFSDPERVAVESLKHFYPGQIPSLRTSKKTPARHVFHWRRGRDRVVVVVTRPYWLSFYASSSSVAWVSTMIKEASCK